MALDITSYVLGKKNGGGSPTPPNLQIKDITINQDGETTITADSGYDGLEKVNLTTNVGESIGLALDVINGEII